MASILVFCVPCGLVSICLDPTHLVTCLLIHFPQLLSLLPSSFAPFIISLCLQFRLGSLPYVGSSYVLCPALPCPALSCLPVCFSPTGLFLFVLFIIINKNPVYTPPIGSSLSSLPPNLTLLVLILFKFKTRPNISGIQVVIISGTKMMIN